MGLSYKCKEVKVVDKVSKNGKNYQVFVVVLENGKECVLGFANFKELYNLERASK